MDTNFPDAEEDKEFSAFNEIRPALENEENTNGLDQKDRHSLFMPDRHVLGSEESDQYFPHIESPSSSEQSGAYSLGSSISIPAQEAKRATERFSMEDSPSTLGEDRTETMRWRMLDMGSQSGEDGSLSPDRRVCFGDNEEKADSIQSVIDQSYLPNTLGYGLIITNPDPDSSPQETFARHEPPRRREGGTGIASQMLSISAAPDNIGDIPKGQGQEHGRHSMSDSSQWGNSSTLRSLDFANFQLPKMTDSDLNPGPDQIKTPEFDFDPLQSWQKNRDNQLEPVNMKDTGRLALRLQQADFTGPQERKSYWPTETGPVSREDFNEYTATVDDQMSRLRLTCLESAETAYDAKRDVEKYRIRTEKAEAKSRYNESMLPKELAKWLEGHRSKPNAPVLRRKSTDVAATLEEKDRFLYDNFPDQVRELKIGVLIQRAQIMYSLRNWSNMAWMSDRAMQEAKQLQYRPIEGKCAFYKGVAAYGLRSYFEAEKAFEQALDACGYYTEGSDAEGWYTKTKEALCESPTPQPSSATSISTTDSSQRTITQANYQSRFSQSPTDNPPDVSDFDPYADSSGSTSAHTENDRTITSIRTSHPFPLGFANNPQKNRSVKPEVESDSSNSGSEVGRSLRRTRWRSQRLANNNFDASDLTRS